MKDLFGNDNALKMRDSKGRYATPLKAYADKAKHDAEYWRFQAEKYMRLYDSIAWMLGYKDRIIKKLKDEIQSKRLSDKSK
jgi:hypothetical protein